jgi:hypothetical protein
MSLLGKIINLVHVDRCPRCGYLMPPKEVVTKSFKGSSIKGILVVRGCRSCRPPQTRG